METQRVFYTLPDLSIEHGISTRRDTSRPEKERLLKEQLKRLDAGIELPNGARIGHITRKDAKMLKEYQTVFTSYNVPVEGTPILEMYMQRLKNPKPEHLSYAFKSLNDVILALRLLKSGHISGESMFWIRMSEPPEITRFSSINTARKPLLSVVYTLQFDELPALNEIVSRISQLDTTKRRPLHLACTRFERAYDELDDDDRLIDFMIAFEALFLKGMKSRSSQGEQISVACAYLLGKSEQERENIKNLLKEAYNIRNCIVHGSTHEKLEPRNQIDLHEFVNRIEDYLRESIKKCID